MPVNAHSGGVAGSLNGFFKEKYSDAVKDLVPDNVILMKEIDFIGQDKLLGNLFHAPVVLSQEQGISYGGSDGSAFALEDSQPSQVKDATIQGYEYLLRSQISYAVASRAASSGAAFDRTVKHVVANMMRSLAKRLEIIHFYGQKPLAVAAAGSTTTSIVVSAANWAPGIWAGAENASIEVFDSGGTLRGSSKITFVNMETRTLTISPAITGLVATDEVHFKGARTGASSYNEHPGLHQIISQASGNLFGISVTAYSLWKGNLYDAGGSDLSFGKIQAAIARAVERGLDEDVMCLVNPRAWSKLMTDQAALRMYDSSYQLAEAKNGAQAIKFYSQNGVVEIRPCNMVKESHAFIIPPKELSRVGSTDLTFNLPGGEGNDRFFRELESNAGFELRLYTDQALFTNAPSKLVLIYNIVNS